MIAGRYAWIDERAERFLRLREQDETSFTDRVDRVLLHPALGFAISVIGVLVFTGLTAYDTQKIKEQYYAGDDDVVSGRKAIMGALNLYLDFINLFLMLLRLFGQNRE